MNLDEVLGIIIYDDGVGHTFGKSKREITKYLNENNFHDVAFNKEILPTEWFRSTGYKYDSHNNIVFNGSRLAAYGFSLIINACSKSVYGDDYYLYTVQTPSKMTDNMKEYFTNFYPIIKGLIEKNNALFYGEAYDENENMIWNETIYDIDEFYDKLNLSRNNNRMK